jgi:hypothetical protein
MRHYAVFYRKQLAADGTPTYVDPGGRMLAQRLSNGLSLETMKQHGAAMCRSRACDGFRIGRIRPNANLEDMFFLTAAVIPVPRE